MADIAINPVTRRVQFTGNTGLGPFAFTFNILADADIAVYKNTTLLTLTTDYTVSTNVNGTGSITLTGSGNGTALIASDVLTIIGGRNLERTTDFVTAGDLLASSLNEQLDSLVIMAQQLDEKMTRSFKVNPGDVFTDLEMPLLDDRKGKYLAFNSTTGDPEAGPDETDVTALAAITSDIATLADIEDGTDATDAIQTVAGISSNVTTVAGISSNVTTVAGISSDVTAVASDATDIGTVATNIASVNTNATNIVAIQNASANAATATTKAAEAATSASNAATSETNSASSAASSATSATNAATSETNASTSETNAATSATNAATSASAAAASQTAAAASAASAASAFDNFDDTYLGSKTSDPTTDNDGDPLNAGDLYFNSTANEMRVYDGANWIAATSAGNVSLLNYNYTATSGQTTFSGADDNAATLSYTQQNLIVTLNGITLEDGTDYTANNGTSIVLASGAATGDELNIVAFKSFTTADMVPASTGGTFSGNVAVTGDLTVDTDTLFVDSTNNQVGIGTSSPSSYNSNIDDLVVYNAASGGITIATGTSSQGAIAFADGTSGSSLVMGRIRYDHSNNSMGFRVNNDEKMSIDSSGNLLVGKTALNSSVAGFEVDSDGKIAATRDGSQVAIFNRLSSDGDIATFRKDGTTVGSIGAENGTDLTIGNADTGLRFVAGDDAIWPFNMSTGADRDNAVSLGVSGSRFDDIYATNGTIQTSDQNEKQQIATLTDAEITAAKAISKLFKTFKWNDSVAEKGDAARTHTGVIAQEVEQAMIDAGLNAGDYAFFISTTWWEAQTEVPAVEADEENGVEAQETYTRTDTYATLEEAPEGATERNRKGIRYPQLMSFIGAATEQRLASIEARLDALEGN